MLSAWTVLAVLLVAVINLGLVAVFSLKLGSVDNRGFLVCTSQFGECGQSGYPGLHSPMPPKKCRDSQPMHLTVDDAYMVLANHYDASDIQEMRRAENEEDCKSKLAFAYRTNNRSKDKDSLYKHREVVKAFAAINDTGIWNWKVILGAMKKWDEKNLGGLLSNSKTYGPTAISLSATNLQQLLQDARNIKRAVKTGSRTPHWLMEILEKLDVSANEPGALVGALVGSPRTIGESWSRSCSPKPSVKKKRTLRLALSTTTEEEVCTKPLLMIEDKKDSDNEDEDVADDDIEDTNSEKFEYAWDDVANKGKRLKPGGRWQLCTRQEKNRESGFMKCFWASHGKEDEWLSEMTILEYEENDPEAGVKKRPAAKTTCSMHEEACSSVGPDDSQTRALQDLPPGIWESEKGRRLKSSRPSQGQRGCYEAHPAVDQEALDHHLIAAIGCCNFDPLSVQSGFPGTDGGECLHLHLGPTVCAIGVSWHRWWAHQCTWSIFAQVGRHVQLHR